MSELNCILIDSASSTILASKYGVLCNVVNFNKDALTASRFIFLEQNYTEAEQKIDKLDFKIKEFKSKFSSLELCPDTTECNNKTILECSMSIIDSDNVECNITVMESCSNISVVEIQ